MADQEAPATNESLGNGRPAPSDEDKAKARKWFKQARVVGETRNYDYAIECYLGGLEIWPDAVEEGHMPLRAISLARKQAGGKPAGFMQSFKRSTTGKDPLRNMLNAAYLLAMDPGNMNHLEQMVLNAGKAHLPATTKWAGNAYFDAVLSEKKGAPQRLIKVRDIFEDLGDQYTDAGDGGAAVEAYEQALRAINTLRNVQPENMDYFNQMTHLSGKLTIARGKYDQDGSFRHSLRDQKGQAEIHDRERLVQGDSRLDELIESARKDYLANPNVPSKLTTLVDLLCKRERKDEEEQAIALLLENHQKSQNYRFKMRADDIRILQLRRRARQLREKLRAHADDKALHTETQKVIYEGRQFELDSLKERLGIYPTDQRIRFKYAQCLFAAGHYDEAISCFQEARIDPRNRTACNLFTARCFFETKQYQPATDVLVALARDYEGRGDEVSKEIQYWLARACEADGGITQAKEAYNQLIQWDYNYRDVRQRLEQIRQQDKSS
jgi:tetratricopeptide (TPR) repeat protein